MRIIIKICFYLIICISLSLQACKYKYEEDFYMEIEEAVPNSTINLNLQEEDLYICDITELSYSYQSENQRFINISVYMDEKRIYESRYEDGSFIIDPVKFGNGSHTLSVKYFYTLGNNRLEDLTEATLFSEVITYQVLIDLERPESIAAPEVYI